MARPVAVVDHEGAQPPVEPPPPFTAIIDGAPIDAGLVGGKGAALRVLIGSGLPVPPCGVVTTATYRALLCDAELQRIVAAVTAGEPISSGAIDEAFLAAPLDADIAVAIVGLAGGLAGERGSVSVRSSATIEDLEQSSFAGQYRSFLDVDGRDVEAVLRAVRLVLASLWHPAPVAYRRALGIEASDAAMAAVIMRMVPARQAGVVFTVDPTQPLDAGGMTRARVEVVTGLGESLVSGQRTPTVHVIERDGGPGAEPPVVAGALELALEIERLAHTAQDVEWAWDGEQLWVVQARPITTLKAGRDDVDDDVSVLQGLDLTTAGIAEMLPGVLPPLTWGLAALLVEEGFRRLLAELGALPPQLVEARGVLRRVNARAALDFALLQRMAGRLPVDAGEELEAQYFGTQRAVPTGVQAARARSRLRAPLHDLRVSAVRKRAVFDVAVVCAAADLLDSADDSPVADGEPAGSTPRRLRVRLFNLLDLGARAMAAEVAVAADAAASYRRLEVLLARHAGATEATRLAAMLTAQVDTPAVSAPASAAVFAGPTWAELSQVVSTVDRPGGGCGAAASPGGHAPSEPDVAALHDALAAAGAAPAGWRGRLFTRSVLRLAVEVTEQLSRREATKAATLRIGGEVRRVALAAGRWLTDQGRLDAATDVELLTPPELVSALEGGALPPPATLRRRRRALTRAADEEPLPLRFRGLPTPAPPPCAVAAVPQLRGLAASGGRHVGRARLLHGPTDPLGIDEVLVAASTDPSWSPLFVRAGAVVLERGGPLSHAAILARELGVPAVLDVPDATALLDGRQVLVDGDHGVVTVVEPETQGR